MIEKCIICGKEFEASQGYNKGGRGRLKNVFCSLECRKTYKQNIQKKTKIIKCSVCGRELEVAISSCKKVCNECQQKEKEEKRKLSEPHICENCGKEYTWDYRNDYFVRKKPSRFCSVECCNSHGSKSTVGKTKILTCPKCGESFVASIHAPYTMKCDKCKQEEKLKDYISPELGLRRRIRKDKGQGILSSKNYENKSKVKVCLYKYQYEENTLIGKFERSGAFKQKAKTLKKLGFNFENPDVREEFLKIQEFLITEFEINLKSANQIEQENNLAQNVLTTRYFEMFGIEKRNASEATSNAHFLGKLAPPQKPGGHTGIFGYHLDWEGNSHYYRSSYEEDLAKKLDERKIKYKTEVLRIKYFDSKKGIYRTGVPDFYLPEKNVIIEVKGLRFYDPENLKDRKEALNKLGFTFYVYLEKKLLLEDFPSITEAVELLDENKRAAQDFKFPIQIKALLYLRDRDKLGLEWNSYQSLMAAKTLADLTEEDRNYIILKTGNNEIFQR